MCYLTVHTAQTQALRLWQVCRNAAGVMVDAVGPRKRAQGRKTEDCGKDKSTPITTPLPFLAQVLTAHTHSTDKSWAILEGRGHQGVVAVGFYRDR